MLRERAKIVAWLAFAADLFALLGAFFAAWLIRNSTWWASSSRVSFNDHYRVLLLAIPAFVLSFYYARLYESFRVRSLGEETALTLRASLCAVMVLVLATFLLNYKFVSRLFVVLFAILSCSLVAGQRVASRLLLRAIRKRGYDYRNFLIVGSGEPAREIVRAIREHGHWGIRLIGQVSDNDGRDQDLGIPLLGSLQTVPRLMEKNIVDGVFFATHQDRLNSVKDSFLHCQLVGVPAYMYAKPFDGLNGRVRFEDLGGISLITFPGTPFTEYELLLKRLFDLIASLVLIVFFAPIMLGAALLIKLTSSGPVIFRQVRVGKNGRRFTMFKFRTMIDGAEKIRDDLADLNEMDGPAFKLSKDPRVTPVGRFLRRTSFDELPQLFNVSIGHMSIVGPRPPLPEEVEKYESWQRRRLSVKPGLTCLWQVSGRNKLDFKTWMKLDLEYVDNWSWWLDLRILMRTIPAMIQGR